MTSFKKITELLSGDIIVYPTKEENGGRCHFQIIGSIEKEDNSRGDSWINFKGKLLWAETGKYYGEEAGYIESFGYPEAYETTFEVKKTSKYGLCSHCGGDLHWNALALKCLVCFKVH